MTNCRLNGYELRLLRKKMREKKKGVFVFGSLFSDLRFRVLGLRSSFSWVFVSREKILEGKKKGGSSFSGGLRFSQQPKFYLFDHNFFMDGGAGGVDLLVSPPCPPRLVECSAALAAFWPWSFFPFIEKKCFFYIFIGGCLTFTKS